jgi:hypothetical protein
MAAAMADSPDTLIVPRGFNADALIAPMNVASASRDPRIGHPAVRRQVTRDSPVRFALMYLPHLLRSRETGWQMSLNWLHLKMAHDASMWAAKKALVRRWRRGYIGPRDVGKSLWGFEIDPLWALAHEHRNFFMAFSNNGKQARRHLANIRRELETNELLLGDFPHLRPKRRRGWSDTDVEVNRGPVTFAAVGIDEQSQGIRRDHDRPQILWGDDLEPDAARYSPKKVKARLDTLINSVFGMNPEAAIGLTGYTTMRGTIIHQMVQHALGEKTADWIVEQGFADNIHYFPPVIEHRDGTRESLWGVKWSLGYLDSMYGTRYYALNFLNNPAAEVSGSTWWTRSLIRWNPDAEVQRPIMWVDPAVSNKEDSDYTAITIAALTMDYRKVVIAYCRGFRCSPEERKRKIHALAREWGVREVFVEVNQGGDLWPALLGPMPPGVTLEVETATRPKEVRIEEFLHAYEKREVEHLGPLPDLEDQQVGYPDASVHDDLIDSGAGATDKLLSRRARR